MSETTATKEHYEREIAAFKADILGVSRYVLRIILIVLCGSGLVLSLEVITEAAWMDVVQAAILFVMLGLLLFVAVGRLFRSQ